jgi:hypothetical protein
LLIVSPFETRRLSPLRRQVRRRFIARAAVPPSGHFDWRLVADLDRMAATGGGYSANEAREYPVNAGAELSAGHLHDGELAG